MSSFGVSLSGLSACRIKQHVIGHPLELSIRNPHLIGGHFQNDLCMWCLKRPAQPKFQWDIKAIEANARWRHNMPAVMCRAGFRFVCHAIFSRTMSLSAFIGGASRPLRRKLTPTGIRQNRKAKMHSDPDRDIFCWSRDTVLLCAKSLYLQAHIYVFTTRSVARLSEIVARLTATTAILSRMRP